MNGGVAMLGTSLTNELVRYAYAIGVTDLQLLAVRLALVSLLLAFVITAWRASRHLRVARLTSVETYLEPHLLDDLLLGLPIIRGPRARD